MKTLKPGNGLFLLVILMSFSLFPAVGCGSEREWAKPVSLAGSKNFYQVTKDLYRAAQPDAKAMQIYATYGIKTVINLRALHSDQKKIQGTNLKLIEIPINTWAIDNDDDLLVASVLQAIRDSKKPVLVHCQHGSDRTGMIIAMYRIVEQGWSKEEAIEEMTKGNFGFHSIWTNIPEYIRRADIAKIRKALN